MKFVYSLLVGNKVLHRRQCRIGDMLQKLYDVGGVEGEFKILGDEVDFPYGHDVMRFAMIEFSRACTADEMDYGVRRDRNDIEHGLRLQLDEELEDAIDNSGQHSDLILSYVQGPIWDNGRERADALAFAAEMRRPFDLLQRLRRATNLLEKAKPCIEHVTAPTEQLRADITKFLDEETKRAKRKTKGQPAEDGSEAEVDAAEGRRPAETVEDEA